MLRHSLLGASRAGGGQEGLQRGLLESPFLLLELLGSEPGPCSPDKHWSSVGLKRQEIRKVTERFVLFSVPHDTLPPKSPTSHPPHTLGLNEV